MEVRKYIYVVNPVNIRYRFLQNTDEKLDEKTPKKHKNVWVSNSYGHSSNTAFVINELPKEEWPAKYENVYILNGLYKYRKDAGYCENIFVVNLEALQEFRDLDKVFFPKTIFVRCPECGVEFLTLEASHKDDLYECKVCGKPFHPTKWWLKYQ